MVLKNTLPPPQKGDGNDIYKVSSQLYGLPDDGNREKWTTDASLHCDEVIVLLAALHEQVLAVDEAVNETWLKGLNRIYNDRI